MGADLPSETDFLGLFFSPSTSLIKHRSPSFPLKDVLTLTITVTLFSHEFSFCSRPWWDCSERRTQNEFPHSHLTWATKQGQPPAFSIPLLNYPVSQLCQLRCSLVSAHFLELHMGSNLTLLRVYQYSGEQRGVLPTGLRFAMVVS